MPFDRWQAFLGGQEGFLVALTSIHWREAWKYGERAFRYCQHDVGHAIAALRVSAALFGWRLRLLPEWSDDDLSTLLGVDRDEDRGDAEAEHPECLALVGPSVSWNPGDRASIVAAAARSATWQGRANVLSRGHDQWEIIDQVTAATHYAGQLSTPKSQFSNSQMDQLSRVRRSELGVGSWKLGIPEKVDPSAPQRRSVRWAHDAAAGTISVDVVRARSRCASVRRDRLAAACPSRAIRPPRGRTRSRCVCLRARVRRRRRMACRDAAGVPVGAGRGRIVSRASDGRQVGRQPHVVRSRSRAMGSSVLE